MNTPTTLVCFPFAGSGASFFRPWRRGVGEGAAVLPVQLPGREQRLDEPLLLDIAEAIDALAPDLLRQVEGARDVVVFGHSLGAMLAYEFARRLEPRPDRAVRLVVSGSPAPDRPRVRRAGGLPDEAFLKQVGEFAAYSHEALDDPEMREMLLPILRADVRMHESYVPRGPLALAHAVTCLRGRDDTLVAADDARDWARLARGNFDYLELPGGHMYLADSAEALIRLLVGRAAATERA